jgi:hypothetical protein
VRVLSLARILFAFLAFQLALGLQVGVAYAAAGPAVPTDAAPMQMPIPSAAHKTSNGATKAASSDDACPMHKASSPMPGASSSMHTALSPTSSHAKAPLEKSTDRHDCCKASRCPCQCGNAPLAFNVTAVRGTSATARVQPIRAIGALVAPSDTHFRPPIVS